MLHFRNIWTDNVILCQCITAAREIHVLKWEYNPHTDLTVIAEQVDQKLYFLSVADMLQFWFWIVGIQLA